MTPAYDYAKMVLAIKKVNDYYGFDIRKSSRKKKMVYRRSAVIVIFRNEMHQRYSDIAELMRCNHATVIHHVKNHNDRMNPVFSGTEYREIYEEISQILNTDKTWKNPRELITTLQSRKSLPLQKWPEYTTKPSGRWKQCAKSTEYLTSLAATS